MAVYPIYFLLAATAILLNWCNWNDRLPIPSPIFHLGLTLLSVLLYTSAVVLWPLYQFVEKFSRQPQRSNDVSCHDRLTSCVCVWEP